MSQLTSPDELVANIQSLISDQDAELTIMPDHGFDEAVLIGTRDAYLRVAATFVRLAIKLDRSSEWEENNISEDQIGSARILSTNEVKHCFNEWGRVWPVCAYLARSAGEADSVVREFDRVNSGHGA
jgi:hypothetical protein